MRTFRFGVAGCGVLCACLCSSQLAAQSAQKFSLQVSGLYENLGGEFWDAYKSIDGGAGAEAQIRYTPSAFSIGLGAQYTGHGFNFSTQSGSITGTYNNSGVFLEPRYVFPVSSNTVAPYISGRFSMVSAETSGPDGGGWKLTFIGTSANGGGGLLIRMGSRMNLDLGATYGYTRYTSAKLTFGGSTETETGSKSGTNLVTRIGLAIGLGG
jgi:hypothetical protein